MAGSIVSPAVTFGVQKWLKRPKLRVEVTRVNARFENIFRMGYFETALAEMHEDKGSLSTTGLGHFLDRYIELTLTLEDSPKLSIAVVILESGKTSEEFNELLAPSESGFEAITRPVLEERVSRVFYIDEATVKMPIDSIRRVFVRDTSGATHGSKRLANIGDLDAKLERNPLYEAGLRLDREPTYELKRSPSWLGFGINCGNIGWHVGARIKPENGTSYQPAFDEEEASKLAQFVRQLPGCDGLSHLTVNDGVLLANTELTNMREFSKATRAIHVADSGVTEICFREPGADDLQALYSVLAVALSTAHYLNLTRMTWPKQRLHVGYGGTDAKGFIHLPEPGGEKYDTIDVSRVNFGTQLAGLVVDLLRDAHGPLRDRAAVIASLNEYWTGAFPAGLAELPERSRKR